MDDDCSSVQSMLPWVINGTLTSAGKRVVFAHLTNCCSCRSELAWLHALAGSLEEASSDRLPSVEWKSELKQDIMKQIHASSHSNTQRSWARWLAYTNPMQAVTNILMGTLESAVTPLREPLLRLSAYVVLAQSMEGTAKG